MYTKAMFGQDLKEKVRTREDQSDIGNWAFLIEENQKNIIDSNFREIISKISNMLLGPYLYFSYEELDKIADCLIMGKESELVKEFEKQRLRSQIEFAKKLKERIKNREDRDKIGHWAFSIYMDVYEDFGSILYAIAVMESDEPGFLYSYEDLDKIADELLTGKPLDWQDFDKRPKSPSNES